MRQMRYAVLVLGSFLALLPAGEAQEGIQSSAEYAPYEPIELRVEHDVPDGATVSALWRIDSEAQYRKVSPSVVHVWAPPSRDPYQCIAIVFTTKLVTIDGEHLQVLVGAPVEYETSFIVTGSPPGPDPPEPDPEPDPPSPDGANPFADSDFRVMFVYEHDQLADIVLYPPERTSTLFGPRVRQAIAALGAEARFFDQHATGATNVWTNALARERMTVPWLLIGHGTRGYDGPMPPTEADTIKLIERFK